MAAITYSNPTAKVNFSEMTAPRKSPIEAQTEQGFRATRYLKCAWRDRLTLMDALTGAYRIELTNSSLNRRFVRGDKYPWREGVFFKRVSNIEPFGEPSAADAGNHIADWDGPGAFAVLTCEYEEQDFNDDTQQTDTEVKYAEEEISVAAEYLTLPSEKLKWVGSNTEIGDATVARVVRMLEWNISFTEMDTIPQGLADHSGKVNSVSVTSRTLGVTFGPEQLLYNGIKAKRELFIDGARAWAVTLGFLLKPFSWNKAFRAGKQAPQAMKSDTEDPYKPYPIVSFAGSLGI